MASCTVACRCTGVRTGTGAILTGRHMWPIGTETTYWEVKHEL